MFFQELENLGNSEKQKHSVRAQKAPKTASFEGKCARRFIRKRFRCRSQIVRFLTDINVTDYFSLCTTLQRKGESLFLNTDTYSNSNCILNETRCTKFIFQTYWQYFKIFLANFIVLAYIKIFHKVFSNIFTKKL